MTADPKPTVHEAILEVMNAVRAVGKDDVNSQQGFRFRGVDAVVNALSPEMRRHGLTVHPHLHKIKKGRAETSNGRQMNMVDVEVDYVFTGPNGSSIAARVPGEAFDTADKATAKAMSVAFRTCLIQTFALPTDDVDPDEDSEPAAAGGQPTPEEQLAATVERNLAMAGHNVTQLESMLGWALKSPTFPGNLLHRIQNQLTEARQRGQ